MAHKLSSDTDSTSLLPAGLQDVLPGEADHEAAVVEKLVHHFRLHGYQRVKPPMIEFEESLFTGPGAKLKGDSYRIMDPQSHNMLGIRADMTPQIARIAATRLTSQPRPLRLCYAGQVLRLRGTQLRPERQFGQVGAELIGSENLQADIEAILLAVDALQAIGVTQLSLDLCLPPLTAEILKSLHLSEAQITRITHALDQKDQDILEQIDPKAAQFFQPLLAVMGNVDKFDLQKLPADLPETAQNMVSRLEQAISILKQHCPALPITLDLLERRGFDYQSDMCFSLYAKGAVAELGRGGRYVTPNNEPAVGFSLFTDILTKVSPVAEIAKTLFVPLSTEKAKITDLHQQGWKTISALEVYQTDQDLIAAAQQQKCDACLTVSHHIIELSTDS